MLHQRLCSDNSMFSFRNEINMAIQMELILDVFYQCNIIHTTDFFPMKITRSPFSLVPFLFKFCLKIPDCDQYKSRRRLSGNGCYIANTTLANPFCTFSNKWKYFLSTLYIRPDKCILFSRMNNLRNQNIPFKIDLNLLRLISGKTNTASMKK